MSRFGECFFLIFGQLAVGGMIALAVPDFRRLERGFYKSSAGIFCAFGLLFVLARLRLVLADGAPTTAVAIELACWTAFVAACGGYLASLFAETPLWRARTFAATLLLGLAAVVASSVAYRPAALSDVPHLLYALPFITASLSLGGVTAGMLLGHWYLIDLGLSIEPLRRMHRLFMLGTAWHLLALLLVPIGVWLTSTTGAERVVELVTTHRLLLVIRLLLGPVPALAVGWLIHRTLLIPQTMAATGLFYIAILFVLVGEMVGALVLLRTGLPL